MHCLRIVLKERQCPYKLAKNEGGAHIPTFTVAILLGGVIGTPLLLTLRAIFELPGGRKHRHVPLQTQHIKIKTGKDKF